MWLPSGGGGGLDAGVVVCWCGDAAAANADSRYPSAAREFVHRFVEPRHVGMGGGQVIESGIVAELKHRGGSSCVHGLPPAFPICSGELLSLLRGLL